VLYTVLITAIISLFNVMLITFLTATVCLLRGTTQIFKQNSVQLGQSLSLKRLGKDNREFFGKLSKS